MSDSSVSFCVGTGRCGTTFLAQLAELEPDVAASHERLRLPATFHMYCKWHGIAVDPEGFLIDREAAIREDLRDHRVSFESSALLSHSIAELHARFDARFLLLVRSPGRTVASFAARGWFLDPIPWRDPALPPTLREGVEPRHFFGRNLPRGAEYARWSALSQVGKIAWKPLHGSDPRHPRPVPRVAGRALSDRPARGPRLRALRRGRDVPRLAPDDRPRAVCRARREPAQRRAERAGRARCTQAAADLEAEVTPLAAALGYEHRAAQVVAGADISRALPPVADVLAELAVH